MANRVTKNINIRERNIGIVIYNNAKVVAVVGSVAVAKSVALAYAIAENKGVVVDTDYYHETISADKVALLDNDEILSILYDLASNENLDFEIAENAFFAITETKGMTTEEAVILWNEYQVELWS